ncbi:MAG: hypothetical protein E7289_01535 [Lachnospiraceae bacterium]|nr:hypothetical protein [Lachnospiraceae bacterium]
MEQEETMRTNRAGNLKRFFHIADDARVLELTTQQTFESSDDIKFDFIFWNPLVDRISGVSAEVLFDRLAAGGKLILYFDNPVSVHAFATGNVDAIGNGIGYDFLKRQLEELRGKREVHYRWYYPYPSVSFPVAFYSDNRLPGPGECEDNYYNFERACLEVFDEREVTGRIASDGMYPYLAHAYMLVISPETLEGYPNYTRFSNERRMQAQIRTDLYDDSVQKSAVTPEAKTHVLRMRDVKETLAGTLKDISLLGRECVLNEMTEVDEASGIVRFAYAEGKSLEQVLDEMLADGKCQEAEQVLLSFCERLSSGKELASFEMTEAFAEMFGDVPKWQQYGWRSLPVSDIDLVSQNILLSEKAVVIDYEWTFEFPIPVEFLVFRFLYFYLEAKNRNPAMQGQFSEVYQKAGITEEMKEIFLAMETNFQHWVQHGAKVLCNSFDEEGKPVLTAGELADRLRGLDDRYVTLVGEGGQRSRVDAGRAKENTYVYKLPKSENGIKVELTGFDASEEGEAKVLRLGAMADRGGNHVGLSVETDGMHLGGLLYLYENCLPQLTVSGFAQEDDGAEISVEEISMSEAAIREIKTTIADMRFIIDNREQQIRDLKNSASWKVTKPLRMLKGNKEE